MELKSSWECHRCKQVNAPHIDHCSCQPNAQPFPWPYGTIIVGDTIPSITGPSTSILGTVSGAGYALSSLSDNMARFVDGKPV